MSRVRSRCANRNPTILNVESLRRVCISDRQMRFVQVHVIRLHALPV